MSSTLDELVTKIKTAQAKILDRGRALRVMVEMSDERRRQRARGVLEGKQIKWLRGEDHEPVVSALVAGTGDESYTLSLTFGTDREGRSLVRKQVCDCPDHGRAGSCKHILAVAGAWILTKRREYKRLQAALEALTLDPAPPAGGPSARG